MHYSALIFRKLICNDTFYQKNVLFLWQKRQNMNKEITEKLKKMRVARGINQTEMAEKLNITRSAYQKIETSESYAWAKYLNELMDILETTPKDFFNDIDGQTVYQNNHEGSIGYVVKHLHQENKEVYEKLIASKDEKIEFLKQLLEKK
jgi:transcriptional regulator with XRE-family HTH domain